MLTTYDRILGAPTVTRFGGYTYDRRNEHELVKQLEAEVEALRRRVKELEGRS